MGLKIHVWEGVYIIHIPIFGNNQHSIELLLYVMLEKDQSYAALEFIEEIISKTEIKGMHPKHKKSRFLNSFFIQLTHVKHKRRLFDYRKYSNVFSILNAVNCELCTVYWKLDRQNIKLRNSEKNDKLRT